MSRKSEIEMKLHELRVPPHSVNAEQSVLGSLLLDNLAWDRAGDILRDADFYRLEHRLIYAALTLLIGANRPADVITVFEQLKAQGQDEVCGGLAYLNAVAQCVASSANVRQYAEIVREMSVLRDLIAAGDETIEAAFNPAGRPVAQILDAAEAKILAIGEQGARAGKTWQSMDEIVVRLIDRVNELHDKGPTGVTGVPTGFPAIDRMTSGLQPTDLVILAARPSMGKTALALNIGEHVAIAQALPVLVFSMEMSADQLGIRLAGSVGRVDQQRLRNGSLTNDDWGRLSEAVDKLGRASLHIDETGALSPAELRARARRKARELGGKLGLIIVDYLQLMSPSEVLGERSSSSENRATVLGEISRGLKALAKELKCPVLALSQLNRSVESRTDKRPLMSDLRESGAIEQDADTIMFIYRDDYYNKLDGPTPSREPGVAEIIISKQRNGPTGTAKLAFVAQCARFENLAP